MVDTDSSAWPTFQSLEFSLPPEEPTEIIIKDVLNTFEIPYKYDVVSGDLKNVDLNRIAPIEAIKVALLEYYAKTGDLVEFCVDEEGEVKTYTVGEKFADLDIYYTIKSSSYLPKDVNVMVVGGKPRAKRVVVDFFDIVGGKAKDTTSTVWDTTALTSDCRIDGFSTSAVITYKDPLLTTGQGSYKTGIEGIFTLENPFQTILGWAWRVNTNRKLNSQVRIIQQNQSSIPVLVTDATYKIGGGPPYPYIGTLRRRKYISSTGDNPNCILFEEEPGTTEDPMICRIPIKEGMTYTNQRGDIVSKFLQLNQIYVVAINLSSCHGIPIPEKYQLGNSEESTMAWISSRDVVKNIYNLKVGIDYIEVVDEEKALEDSAKEDFEVKIQFANNANYYDKALYGTGVPFYVDLDAKDLVDLFSSGTIPDRERGVRGVGTILPVGENEGLLIEQVWAQIDLDTPCFVISDNYGKAVDIANDLHVSVAPIVIEDRPAPIAMNGELIDQSIGVKDNDPTTSQDFEDTPIELATKNMKGRTLNVTLASLTEEEEVVNLSRQLNDLLRKSSGINYTHTCSPNSKPELGTRGPNGGIINSITYNYTDSGSYLITVVEGSEYYGDFAGISSGVYNKQVEDVTAVGTIIQDAGDHINYKVRVDGIGTVWAINSYPGVLEIRDRVNITIHNNAVEA